MRITGVSANAGDSRTCSVKLPSALKKMRMLDSGKTTAPVDPEFVLLDRIPNFPAVHSRSCWSRADAKSPVFVLSFAVLHFDVDLRLWRWGFRGAAGRSNL